MLVLLELVIGAAPARADWLVIPFAGTVFGGETTSFLDLEQAAGGAKGVIGVTGTWLTNQVIGVEGELMYGPSFFERGEILALKSYLATASVGLLVTLPLAVTRESLRPDVVGGLGTMRASADYSVDLFDQSQQFTTLHVGAGAIGFITPFTGVRFDVRHVNSLNRVSDEVTTAVGPRMRFWRASVGVVLRIG